MDKSKRWELTAYGRWLKITLMDRNMPASELAKSLGIPKQRISEFMHGLQPYEKYGPQIEKMLGATPPTDIAS